MQSTDLPHDTQRQLAATLLESYSGAIANMESTMRAHVAWDFPAAFTATQTQNMLHLLDQLRTVAVGFNVISKEVSPCPTPPATDATMHSQN